MKRGLPGEETGSKATFVSLFVDISAKYVYRSIFVEENEVESCQKGRRRDVGDLTVQQQWKTDL